MTDHKEPRPPRLIQWILTKLLPSEERRYLKEGIEERYSREAKDSGRITALFWYLKDMAATLPLLILDLSSAGFIMFRNHLISFCRILQRHKLYSSINIAGLAVGLAICILISLWIGFELSYDRFHENADDLYQVFAEHPLPNGDLRYFTNTPGALAHALKAERPEIRHVTRFVDQAEMMLGRADQRFLEKVSFADPAFLKMFSLEFIEGNPETALSQPNSIVLTERIARKHFANEDALGKEIVFGADMSLMVTGIIKEIPENSFLTSQSLVPIAVCKEMGWDIDAWGGGNYETYILLERGTNPGILKTQIRDFYETHAPNWKTSKLSFRPIASIHLYGLGGGGPVVYVYIFSAMTVFILLLAMVNFVNLSTARSMHRAKEIGVRKIVGATRDQLARQILVEAMLVTLFSGAFAVVIAFFLLPVMNQLTEARITFGFSATMIITLIGTVILTGLISGIYPAYILSSLLPVRAVKGGLSPGKNSLLLRKGLIVFQFSLSIFMIIAMLGINKQLKYLNSKELGYTRDNVISLGLAREVSRQYSTVRAELMRNPEILSLTRSSSTMDRENTTTGEGAVSWEGQPAGLLMPRTHLMRVDPEFIDTFQIELAEGRFFSREFPNDQTGSAVINETALKTMDLRSPIGKRITVWNQDFRIIGVVKDFHFYSLRSEIQPLIFISRYAGFQNIFIRINTQNLTETLDFIKTKLKEIAPGYIPDIGFLDKRIRDIYLTERRMQRLTKYFSFLAAFISCIGLLGLVSFSIKQRTKEIAIRKVLGASEGNIAYQLFRETFICVAAANVVVYPAAYFALRSWLQNYAYHTSLGIGIFVLASALTLALALLSVGWNVLKASLARPVVSLRYE